MLRQIAARGGLVRLGHGLYRFPLSEIRPTFFDPFAEAVARVGRGAYLTHDAVLALHGLGLVNPQRIRVGTPRRVRADVGDMVQIVHQPTLSAAALTVYGDSVDHSCPSSRRLCSGWSGDAGAAR